MSGERDLLHQVDEPGSRQFWIYIHYCKVEASNVCCYCKASNQLKMIFLLQLYFEKIWCFRYIRSRSARWPPENLSKVWTKSQTRWLQYFEWTRQAYHRKANNFANRRGRRKTARAQVLLIKQAHYFCSNSRGNTSVLTTPFKNFLQYTTKLRNNII